MSWQSVRGHDALVEGFARAARRGRLAHAYLFVGLAGIGKRRFARQLAKTLLCERPPADRWDSCDQCAACKLVDAGTHPDLIESRRPDDKTEFPIDTMREVCDALALKPARGSRKITIIDDADDLNEESGNCFLKTLEEPPPGSILILLATSADPQLPTIRSRCQVITFQRLPIPLVEELLRESGADPAEIPQLAQHSGGSLDAARELAIPGLWDFRSRLLDALRRPGADTVALTQTWSDLVAEAGTEMGANWRRASVVIRLIIRDLEAALVGRDDADRGLVQLGHDRLAAMVDRCLLALEQIDRRVQLAVVMEALIDALAARPSAA